MIASMADSKVSTCVFLLLTTLIYVTGANPVSRSNERSLYEDLINGTRILWNNEKELLKNFKAARLTGFGDSPCVLVPNGTLPENMNITFRQSANKSQLLSAYYNSFTSYHLIMEYVLEDEKNTSYLRNFICNISFIKISIGYTITKITNLTNHLGISIPEGEQVVPFFRPRFEKSVYRRHLRDCYILQQLEQQLDHAVNDFSALRDNLS